MNKEQKINSLTNSTSEKNSESTILPLTKQELSDLRIDINNE
jgi:hypothetical protein